MDWLNNFLLNALPVFIVMSLLVVLVPSLRRHGAWGGLGAAWGLTFVAALVVAVTHQNAWSLDCSWLNVVHTGVTSATALGAHGPCTTSNGLDAWLIALPPLIGLAILVAWVWRHTRPMTAALQAIAALLGMAVVTVVLVELSEGAGLLFAVAVGAAFYAWPRLRRQPAT